MDDLGVPLFEDTSIFSYSAVGSGLELEFPNDMICIHVMSFNLSFCHPILRGLWRTYLHGHMAAVCLVIFCVIGFRSSESGRARAFVHKGAEFGHKDQERQKKNALATGDLFDFSLEILLPLESPQIRLKLHEITFSPIFYMSFPSCLSAWPAIFLGQWLVTSDFLAGNRAASWLTCAGWFLMLQSYPRYSQVFPGY